MVWQDATRVGGSAAPVANLALPVLCLGLVVSLCACGGDPSAGPGGKGSDGEPSSLADSIDKSGDLPPSMSELQDYLASELVRLGKTPGGATLVAQSVDADRLQKPPPQRSSRSAGGRSDSAPERRLPDGIRSASAAPSGADNAVFDLSAVLIDSSGNSLTPEDISAGAEVSGVRLDWTERLIGDYDQNGEVNVGDITPLALHWQKSVNYDDPALHGGFERWPSGDPEDDGTGAASSVGARTPTSASERASHGRPLQEDGGKTAAATGPDPGSGAANWRLARVDGDGNGEINIADITPIAAHWLESSDGYRLYRKAPSESGFTALPYAGGSGGGPPPSFDITVLRTDAYPDGASQPDPQRPLRLALADGDARADKLGIGVYSYYVVAYDAQTDTEGPRSAAVSIDLATGSVNFAPVAKLSVSPDFGGAPVVITLDASASYDLDGSLAELQWDLDADGTVDYKTSDPVPPAASSGGDIDCIIPGPPPDGGSPPGPGNAPRSLSARYTQGSAKYMYPKVRVVDDKGTMSAWQSAKLGISGWERQLVSSTDALAEFDGDEWWFNIQDMAVDPFTDELVVFGIARKFDTPFAPNVPVGAYVARRDSQGHWQQEMIADYSIPVLHELGGEMWYGQLGWQSNGEMFVLMEEVRLNGSPQSQVYLGLGQSNGVWDWSYVYGGHDGKSGFFTDLAQREPGEFACILRDQTGSNLQFEFEILVYKNGEITVEDPGFYRNSDTDMVTPEGLYIADDGSLYVYENSTIDRLTLRYKHRVAAGQWEDGTFAYDGLGPIDNSLQELGKLDARTCMAARIQISDTTTDYAVLQEGAQGFKSLWRQSYQEYGRPTYSIDEGAVSVLSIESTTVDDIKLIRGSRIEPGRVVEEQCYSASKADYPELAMGAGYLTVGPDGQAHALLSIGNSEFGSVAQVVLDRVDPLM
jgi:hypothetical protein